ncbi:L-lactate dehydrogenase [Mycoplasma sp. Mirounga ES2805-ORL]|uniref:lactate/malate family dehydrogenase n=1 Tax=Mycoplasma sp. Mirounga ES2805-ORL TaxID=754514 RepID=UPI00197BBC51|nr:L-lactate dehydrogenase [Mycoplasma sp. Mirounga ES2805-ORL]QSF13531.1 L-lactate dehydrogenase [Mycoplasma sp. Mirounga ES2805-ORL]
MNKIVVIGLGNVGFTYINIALSKGVEAEWVLVDKNEDLCIAHAHDFEDMLSINPNNQSTFKVGNLLDAANADIVVITASIPRISGNADRIKLASENVKLMKTFADALKKADFKGIIIVPSNPCDVMAAAFHYLGFPHEKVISTGTLLDTARLRKFIAKKYNVSPSLVKTSIVGEHGTSATPIWSTSTVDNKKLLDLIQDENELSELREKVINEGYYISSRKGNTQFGIGMSIYEITNAILNDTNQIINIGVKLPDNFKNRGIYSSIPVSVGKNGYKYLNNAMFMTDKELDLFNKSTLKMANVHSEILEIIGIKKNFN